MVLPSTRDSALSLLRIVRLYVIGNGFDLYHGLKSSFADFKDYVRNRDRDVFEGCEKLLPVSGDWSNLEEALGFVDSEELLSEGDPFLVSYGADDWSDSSHHDFQWAVDKAATSISSSLVDLLTDWISTVDAGSSDSEALLALDVDARFFSFNYTKTLADVYHIPKEQVCFPHGSIADDPPNLILGHTWEAQERLEDQADEEGDVRVTEALGRIDDFFKETYKPCREIIECLSEYFTSLRLVDKVSVLGHSLHEVDEEYYDCIIKSISPAAQWNVTYHRDADLQRNIDRCEQLGIDRDCVKHITMSEL